MVTEIYIHVVTTNNIMLFHLLTDNRNILFHADNNLNITAIINTD